MSNVLLGMALYGSIFLLPLYLSQMHGYNAEQVGLVLAWTGLPQLLLIPLVPQLMKRFDPRLLIGLGFVLFAGSSFMDMSLDANFAGPQLFWPNIIRAFGQALLLTPLAMIASAGIEPEYAGSASALFNMMRNLGGAVGIAILQTVVTKREQFHSSMIMRHVTSFADATQERITHLQHYFMSRGLADSGLARHEAVVAVGRAVRVQANFLAYGDAFALMGTGLAGALVLALFLTRPAATGGAGGAH